jgi:hypothetical protein
LSKDAKKMEAWGWYHNAGFLSAGLPGDVLEEESFESFFSPFLVHLEAHFSLIIQWLFCH